VCAGNVSSEGCLQAVSPECGLIGGDCEPEPLLVGAECEPKTPLVCGFGCRCLQAATYRCQEHKGATEVGSTYLITDPRGTNVFFENWNKDADRPWGFPFQLVAYGARIHAPGAPAGGYNWPKNKQGFEAKWTQHSCEDENYPPQEAIVASSGLANDGQAFFNIGYLPPYCE
jgi:hypothetical protein